MVKTKDREKTASEQEEKAVEIEKGNNDREIRITAETRYGECREWLTAFGGLLALVKFLNLTGFEKAFMENCKYV